eukprot:TRINITY_DN9545_c0_g1_i9.p1 TRINITY_DN9545_c0_g1~~TRINITY_DN9545_c0_g1_i9.p1  ORF type:complete len:164 (+),score=35.27 TRINITY_DN9545_c0_g1_i9:185-676(+)
MSHKVSKQPAVPREPRRKAKARAVEARNNQKIAKLAPKAIYGPKSCVLLSTFDKSVLSFGGTPRHEASDLWKPANLKEAEKGLTDSSKMPKKNIRLYFENSKRYKNFKLFKEDNLSLDIDNASSQFEDPACDDDCMTENEQIESAVKKDAEFNKGGGEELFQG